MSTHFLIKVHTFLALGPMNVWHVFCYRLRCKLGLYQVRSRHLALEQVVFFRQAAVIAHHLIAVDDWQDKTYYFGHLPVLLGDTIPRWHSNPLTGTSSCVYRPWWQIADFNTDLDDIKINWEASRFAWVLAFAQRVKLGETHSLQRLNAWLADWCLNNPPYFGINWKCGQEAAIRVLHLAMAAYILGQIQDATPALKQLIIEHLERIMATLSYAKAQNNNHGTSEAAALFIGGNWLKALGVKLGDKWQQLGRQNLEKLVNRLIEADGSFSQYSLNYHRVVIDTLSMVEIWRQHLALNTFSLNFQSRVAKAAAWLAAMVDPITGDAPNLGANDGARLLPLTITDYRDYRPSVQLSMALFHHVCAYPPGPWNQALGWLNVMLPVTPMAPRQSQLFNDGGYALLQLPTVLLLFRYPRFRFRPSHADALHVDLWLNGHNLLRDGGTYSYHAAKTWLDYFPGTISHNTVQFDNRDQMPRLSRFLFGRWLHTKTIDLLQSTVKQIKFGASYQDYYGAGHSRRLTLTSRTLQVEDTLTGFQECAVLRWRLPVDDWRWVDNTLTNGRQTIKINANLPLQRLELVEGWESRYYWQKTALPVLEAEIASAGMITTEITW